MEWIPIAAWGGALVVAAVVLGFCAYELAWKTRRLRRDVAGLQELNGRLVELQGGIAAARERIGSVGTAGRR